MSEIVAGLAQFKRNLDKLDKGTRGKLLENACLAGALLVSNKAKENVRFITGTLKRSIHVGNHTAESAPDFTPNDVGGNYGDVAGKKVSGHSATLLVGTNLAYAARIEYGFVGADSLGRVYNQAAQPYLRPAAASEEKAVKKEIGDAVAVLIKKALSGI